MYARLGFLLRLFRRSLCTLYLRSAILLWVGLFLGSVLVQTHAQEDVTLSAVVDRAEVLQNQYLLFTITVRWIGSIGDYDFEWPTSPDCTNLAVVGHATSTRVSSDQGQRVAIKTFSYTLQPLATGRATIGTTTLTYVRKSDVSSQPRRLTTRPITVNILAPTSDAENRSKPYVFVAIVIAAAALSFILFLRHKRTSTPIEEAPSIRSIEDQALAHLDKASGLRLAGELSTYYAEIAQVLTSYLERKWPIQCVGVATYDVIQRMRQQGLPDSIIEETQAILSECDLVKFAGHTPTSSEQDRIYDRTIAFIRHCGALAEQELSVHRRDAEAAEKDQKLFGCGDK